MLDDFDDLALSMEANTSPIAQPEMGYEYSVDLKIPSPLNGQGRHTPDFRLELQELEMSMQRETKDIKGVPLFEQISFQRDEKADGATGRLEKRQPLVYKPFASFESVELTVKSLNRATKTGCLRSLSAPALSCAF